jgi:hypothetical protein
LPSAHFESVRFKGDKGVRMPICQWKILENVLVAKSGHL